MQEKVQTEKAPEPMQCTSGSSGRDSGLFKVRNARRSLGIESWKVRKLHD